MKKRKNPANKGTGKTKAKTKAKKTGMAQKTVKKIEPKKTKEKAPKKDS